MNLNYLGSFSEENVNFSSSVDVVINETNELFNAISVYVPASLAQENIVAFDEAWVTVDKPAVFVCEVSNYKTIMKGKLLDQWMNVFRQDTNIDAVVYVIVFQDGEATAGLWEMDEVSIKFAPLTSAFNKLFYISYVKTLFDSSYDGKPTILPPSPGSAASAQLALQNPTGADLTVPAASYLFNDGVKDWIIPVLSDIVIPAGGEADIQAHASTVGSDADLAVGTVDNADVSPAPPTDLVIAVTSVTQGTDPGTVPIEVPSKYFDFSLALAYLCKLDIKLSSFWSLVKVALPVASPDTNVCWIRSASAADEKAAMTSISTGDRSKYYWGALYLMECMNSMVLTHSEPVNIIVEVLAAWFAARNASEQYIGNKLSLLRLSGTRIKPFGYPSWLASDVNENDKAGHALLDAKNVGYLKTIADNTPQESALTMARGVTGFPVNALMISKFTDYTCAKACALMITDKGTLTNPVLTDEEAYQKIQRIVSNTLGAFLPTKRIVGISLTFPSFQKAKKGLTALEAASAWRATYVDDLDRVTVTGAITAE
jgi:hypothetical protein